MNKILFVLFVLGFTLSCSKSSNSSKFPKVNWNERIMQFIPQDSLYLGSTYLSVYSEIYSYSEVRTYDLTVTVSMKNIYKQDSVFINKIEYFNTEGKSVRTYIDKPIFIKPMETLEIVIDQKDLYGGSGGNMIFDWTVKKPNLEPHFEAVMISTYEQQGLSFTSQGIRIE